MGEIFDGDLLELFEGDASGGGCLEGVLDKLLEGNKDRDLLRLLKGMWMDSLGEKCWGSAWCRLEPNS